MTGYWEQVAGRLDAGSRIYGDESYRRPTRDLLGEIAEELEDVAAWGTIAAAAMMSDPRLTLRQRRRIGRELHRAARQAERSWDRLRRAAR